MNPQAVSPTPADDQPVSDVARRVGPPLVVGVLVLTGALLVWIALAPTAIAGQLSEAPFSVPATLVVPPDDDGCLRVVDGDGSAREHCFDQLATDEDAPRYVEAYFDGRERLLAGEPPELLHVDPVTGEVLGTVDVSADDLRGGEPPRPLPEDAPIEPTDTPPGEDPPPPEVLTDGDRVLRWEFGEGREPDEEQVVLDLEAPPGYELETALLSPDGSWVVALTPDDELIVAPADRSAAPYVWTEVPEGRWIDLWRAIRWDG